MELPDREGHADALQDRPPCRRVAAAGDDFKTKLEGAGTKVSYVDHGAFHSIYFVDPNGLNLELCSLPAIAEEFAYRASKIAHEELRKWQQIRHTIPKSIA